MKAVWHAGQIIWQMLFIVHRLGILNATAELLWKEIINGLLEITTNRRNDMISLDRHHDMIDKVDQDGNTRNSQQHTQRHRQVWHKCDSALRMVRMTSRQ